VSVGSWDPAAGAVLDAALLERFLTAAEALEAEDFALSPDEITRLAPLARQEGAVDWRVAAAGCTSAELEALIRLFTLAEMRFVAWEAGARSPVVPLAALLKARGDYPAELTGWIRSNSSNRFIPHGSLLDRL
jgi:hypothetical protein